MKLGTAIMLALSFLQALGTPPPISRSARLGFMRPINTYGGGEVCAVLDSKVFSHAAPYLRDLRLLTKDGEIPYFITVSEAADPITETASVMQARDQAKEVNFDLKMPPRPYTDVILDLPGKNFVIAATVSGKDDLSSTASTPLGTFTLFDLTARHLSRNTTLPLQESSFRYLHVELRGTRLPVASIHDAEVPPSREAQTIYADVAESSSFQRGTNTVALFHVPAHVPVERVAIEISSSYQGNFSRAVRVTGREDAPLAPVETIMGTISRVRLGKIDERQTTFPASMGVNLQTDATIEVEIEDGSEPRLPITTVKLQMRQRSICFTAPPVPVALFYGDASLSAPRFAPDNRKPIQRSASRVMLGLEIRNPAYSESEDARALSKSRANVLWFLVLGSLGVAGTLMLRVLRHR